MVKFVLRRCSSLLITFIVITALMYACLMIYTPEERASLYFSPRGKPRSSEEYQRLAENIIKRHGLDEPYPVQYISWLTNLFRGEWGFSPIFGTEVFNLFIRRAPVTLELTLYSILIFIPLGIITGTVAGWRKESLYDFSFRVIAFIANSVPLFILAFIMLAVFYISLYWLAPGRIGLLNSVYIESAAFTKYTGLLTVDGFLNGRADISLDAFRHLLLPVLTLCFIYWAGIARLTRAVVIDEMKMDYITAAKARGVPQRRIIWRHVLLNVLSPALTSSAIAAASLITSIFIVEIIYNFNGVSDLIVSSTGFLPDVPSVMAFTVYCVATTLVVMFVMDILRALIDPRIREGVLEL